MPLLLRYVAFGKSNLGPWFNEAGPHTHTEADVGLMEVFGALGGEAGAILQDPHRAQVEAQGHIAVRNPRSSASGMNTHTHTHAK